MPGIKRQCLFISHGGKVFHAQKILCPILKHSPVATVCDQLVWVLRHSLIEVVAQHQHNGCSLFGFMRKCFNITGIDRVIRPEPIHIDSPIGEQFFGKFGCQYSMMFLWEIA